MKSVSLTGRQAGEVNKPWCWAVHLDAKCGHSNVYFPCLMIPLFFITLNRHLLSRPDLSGSQTVFLALPPTSIIVANKTRQFALPLMFCARVHPLPVLKLQILPLSENYYKSFCPNCPDFSDRTYTNDVTTENSLLNCLANHRNTKYFTGFWILIEHSLYLFKVLDTFHLYYNY